MIISILLCIEAANLGDVLFPGDQQITAEILCTSVCIKCMASTVVNYRVEAQPS